MTRDKTPAVRCVCGKFPLVAPGKKIRCVTKGCVFEGWKFDSVGTWDHFHEVRFPSFAVKVCRELGITREGV